MNSQQQLPSLMLGEPVNCYSVLMHKQQLYSCYTWFITGCLDLNICNFKIHPKIFLVLAIRKGNLISYVVTIFSYSKCDQYFYDFVMKLLVPYTANTVGGIGICETLCFMLQSQGSLKLLCPILTSPTVRILLWF